MSLASDIGNWLNNAWDRIFDVGSRLIEAGIDLLPLPPSSVPSPTAPNGGSGGSTPGPGSGSGPSTGGTSGGSSGGYFTDTVSFLRSLGEKETWIRVGLVVLGIALILVALRMMVVGRGPIREIMDDIGV